MTEADAAGRQQDEHDRGLATERTALAWTRSALALAAIGALAVRRGAQGDVPSVAYPVGAVIFGAAVAVWMLGASIYSRRAATAGDATPHAVAFKVMSIGTVAIAVAAIILAVPV